MPACEPRQNRKVAALSSVCHVPQVIRVAVEHIGQTHMSYVALARKWRPHKFEDVIGQKGAVDTLKNAIDAV